MKMSPFNFRRNKEISILCFLNFERVCVCVRVCVQEPGQFSVTVSFSLFFFNISHPHPRLVAFTFSFSLPLSAEHSFYPRKSALYSFLPGLAQES